MGIIKNKKITLSYHSLCVAMIWCISVYSAIVQNVFFEIPYGMLIFGGAILVFYYLTNSYKTFVVREAITEENIQLLWFMAYIFIAGLLFAPEKNNHISQWITCLEYLFIQIVIASIIQNSGTDTFHTLLLIESIILAVIFIHNPVNYENSGRYSISTEVNPNGLGLGFVAGIWAALYIYQKKKMPLVFTGILVALFGYCIMMTGSRKSLVGAGIIIFLWLFICFIPNLKEQGTKKGLTTFFVMLVLVIIIARGFITLYSDATIATRMDNLLYEASEGNRSNMYRDGFELIKKNPIFGIGFRGFQYYYGSYSHATLVEIPVSGGIIGVIMYFATYYISLKKLINIYKESKEEKSLETEQMRIKMIIILWVAMAFYTICIIHPYQFDSCILFGIIFGETAYIDNKIKANKTVAVNKKIGSKYIKV